jgi:sister-chromatid-cohesion protein PDS5
LTSLSEIKSIVLLTDVPNSEPLILHLFTSFFDIISGSSKSSTGEQVSLNVELQMNNLLVTVVDEAASLPTMVIDIIIAQFLRAATGPGKQNGEVADEKQTTLIAKDLPPAYRMAAHICSTCPEKMSRYISQYFNEVILDASGSNGKILKSHDHGRSSVTVDSDDEDAPSGPTEADLKELHKAHRLLRECWRASPSVLQNVIPQLDAELSAENIQLRLLATETLGDIISGIGAAGPPASPIMDPAAWPVLSLSQSDPIVQGNVLTSPKSPESFAQTHPAVYHNFIARKNDKSPIIRSAWTTAIGRVLITSAGGIGLSREDEAMLVKALAEKLNDSDERVRLAAVKAVGTFSFRDLMAKLAPNGDVSKSGSVLCSLADRARDRKHAVRVEGMTSISKIWGVAAGEIAAGNESVTAALSAIPSKIFDAYYANDQDVNVLLDHVMFENLIPLSYPTTKGKSKQSNGDSQTANGDGVFDADKLRTERILLLIRSLDPKAKKAFFAMQARQTSFRNVILQFLKKCEEHNGGVMDENPKEIKAKLTAIIEWLVSMLPDKPRATADLWKYAKLHDRRSYQLIRYAMAPESDFKTVYKAIKEFSKRIEAAPGAPAGLLDTLIPLIFRSGSLVYNKSHLPAILEFSRSDAKGLAATAHEVLKEISGRNPEVFKAQVKELCKTLEEQAPSATKANDLGSVETLKACAGYAQKYPEEIPHDRKFVQALLSFAQYGTPPKAAKYAVSILMAASERKEMHAKDLLQKVTTDWEYGSGHFLTKLAAMSQLTYLQPKVADDVNDKILDITTQQVLLQVRVEAESSDPNWQDESSLDEECQAKCWALKVLVNRIRSIKDEDDIKELAGPVYKLLNTLIFKEGEISKTQTTPKHHRSRLRLVAAQLMLKLCATSRVFDDLLTPSNFVNLACVTQDERFQVRRSFIEKLQKYLVSNRLSNRFYTISFLVAFEPELAFRQTTMTWIRSRTKFFQDASKTVMESLLPRLISLLAHHPDYSPEPEDLADTAHYILFYISAVANEENLGLIYKYAERVKQTKDAVKPTESDNLYVLSDLTQAVIRKWQDKRGWNMQTYSGKTGLSKDLFAALPSHDIAQEIAEKQYLPEDMDDLLDGLVKSADKKKVNYYDI